MNKFLYAGVAVLVLVVAGFALISNKSKTNVNVTAPTVSSSPAASPQSTASQNTVTLTSSGFQPQTLTVKAGTTVTFVNKSGTTAAVNSAIHPTHALFPLLNLETFNDGESLSVNFDKPGTYKYHNHLNPSQTGTVVVE